MAIYRLKNFSRFYIIAICMVGIFFYGGSEAESQQRKVEGDSQSRIITDMAGREVAVPCIISRIATVGAVPVINSYLFAFGEGGKIVNSLPHFSWSRRWKLQAALAPQLVKQPVLQSPVNKEALLSLRPDVIITMDKNTVNSLNDIEIPVIFLEWENSSDMESIMRIIGCMFDRSQRSDEYMRYFEATLDYVHMKIKGCENPPKVLFFDPNTLKAPLPITEWWIREAGGKSVTAEIAGPNSFGYSYEQVLLWNPDIIIVSTPDRVPQVYQDKKLAILKAVKNKRVYTIPMGVHPWGQRTVEQPLTVLWAVKLFFPEQFKEMDIVSKTKDFYYKFFSYNLTNEQAIEIMSGGYE